MRPQSGLIAPDQSTTRAPSLSFGGRRLGGFEPVVVIAEIGINHEGDPEQCARMIEAAAKAYLSAINRIRSIEARAVPATTMTETDETAVDVAQP